MPHLRRPSEYSTLKDSHYKPHLISWLSQIGIFWKNINQNNTVTTGSIDANLAIVGFQTSVIDHKEKNRQIQWNFWNAVICHSVKYLLVVLEEHKSFLPNMNNTKIRRIRNVCNNHVINMLETKHYVNRFHPKSIVSFLKTLIRSSKRL